MRQRYALPLLAPLLLAAAPAAAAGPNGGQTASVDGHAIEFVAAERDLTFYLDDHDGAPLATDGVRARAFVSVEGRTRTLDLAPAPPNRLVGSLPAPLPTGAKVVLSAQVPGHRIQARFQR